MTDCCDVIEYFDRSICPLPCGSMHYRCTGCGAATDGCTLDHQEADDSRPDWDEYFLSIAKAVSARADCTRAKHGAVIVKDHRIVSTGYNGAVAGEPGCLTNGACPRGKKSYEEQPSLAGDYSDCIALHAEVNAVAYVSRHDAEGATIYITGEPCSWCRKVIRASGITRFVYPNM